MDTYYRGEYRTQTKRLSSWDYGSNGKYFVTICTKENQNYFGNMADKKIVLNDIGTHVQKCWESISERYPFVKLDEFIIMPNHIHGIIKIGKKGYRNFTPNKFGPQKDNLGAIIRGFKSGVTAFAKKNDLEFAWHSRYHDRIIRNDSELENVRQYILENPSRWIQKCGI